MSKIGLGAILLALSGAAAAQTLDERIRARCAERYPDSYAVQEYCIGEEAAAAAEIERLMAEASDEDEPTFGRCEGRYPNLFAVQRYCITRELEAKARLEAR